MDEQLSSFGSADSLRFQLRWEGPPPQGTAADATRGNVWAWIGERLVWGVGPGGEALGLDWTWIELLEHISEHWSRLEWEEIDPLDLRADLPGLRAAAEQRWENMPDEQRDEEEEALWWFEEAHDLARGLQGLWTAPLWLQREGKGMWVSSSDVKVRRPAAEILTTLSELGDALCARLGGVGDQRAQKAISSWATRKERPTKELVGIATGLPEPLIEQLASDFPDVSSAFGLPSSGFALTEIQAVARMIGKALPGNQMKSLLARVRGLPEVWTGPIDHLSDLAEKILASKASAKPFDQGHAVARWFRNTLPEQERVDPERILTSWKIPIEDFPLDNPHLDAVCCWGPKCGPAILMNPNGMHGRHPSRRATLAHEIGHLLMDRRDALPIAEVFGGRAPRAVEARARAFAAELLLPKDIAGETLAAESNPIAAVSELCKRFSVSDDLVAWQARNSGVVLSQDTLAYLRTLVSEPWLF